MNDSIIIVSVTKRDEYNSLKCRTVTIKQIEKAFKAFTAKDEIYLLTGEFKG